MFGCREQLLPTEHIPSIVNVLQIENWFITCAGTIYREKTIFLGGGGQTITHAIPNASHNKKWATA